ncbi:hypothetical protein LHV47_10960 [Lacticaseibacillus rhamnosus]|uniref:hypothetical protein n=1 Tax=Lacticaseibacillus rhamnosus TaxID=47715 RepID=UPI001BD49D51|nr:hypothetical protein [Lacticaseibacillus rhamnosus]MBS9786187.1 hypothetical protein [Lacticaseibacillus rhamnosus]MCH5392188.1 hypothetical protein [Lacticaseibacillus rhamnosus]
MKLFEYTGISTTVNHAVAIFMLLHKHDIERFVVYNAPDDMMTVRILYRGNKHNPEKAGVLS